MIGGVRGERGVHEGDDEPKGWRILLGFVGVLFFDGVVVGHGDADDFEQGEFFWRRGGWDPKTAEAVGVGGGAEDGG